MAAVIEHPIVRRKKHPGFRSLSALCATARMNAKAA
jgi:hypothetical protein